MYMRFPGSCFSGCLCRSGFPQFPTLHYLGAASKKLIHLSSLLFVVDLSCIRRGHGILLKILLYCEGGPSLYSFLRKLKNCGEKLWPTNIYFTFSVLKSLGELLECISGAKDLGIAVYLQVLCGQHKLLSELKSKCKIDMHRKEIASA